ncbi:MAG: hypothetical protein HY049_06840 [Acidobacteria bacterium]|nr:hypothetical protein [Acidobacteriota bacterium]
MILLGLGIPAASAGMIEGWRAYASGDFATAAREFSEVVREDPHSADAQLMLAFSLEELKQDDAALAHFLAAYHLRPADAMTSYALAYFHEERKHWAEAAFFASAALEAAGGSRPEYRLLAGQMHVLAGDDSLGAELLDLCPEARDDMATAALLALARFRRNRPGAAIRGLGEALGAARRSTLRSFVVNQVVPVYVSWILEHDCPPTFQAYLDAEPMMFDAWRHAEPGDVRADLWEGLLLVKRSDPERAEAVLGRALDRRPCSCVALYYLALARHLQRKAPMPASPLACCDEAPTEVGTDVALPLLDPGTMEPVNRPIRELLAVLASPAKKPGN